MVGEMFPLIELESVTRLFSIIITACVCLCGRRPTRRQRTRAYRVVTKIEIKYFLILSTKLSLCFKNSYKISHPATLHVRLKNGLKVTKKQKRRSARNRRLSNLESQ